MLVLKCYVCGVSKPADGEISTRTDLETAASQVGFLSFKDDLRTVVVCGLPCASHILTKRGQLLKRLPAAYSVAK